MLRLGALRNHLCPSILFKPHQPVPQVNNKFLSSTNHFNMTSVVSSQPSSVDIVLNASATPGIYSSRSSPISEETTQLTNTVLNDNHKAFHVYFNDRGFHNHIVHHQLSLYALNASQSQVQHAYDTNKSYQLPQKAANLDVVADIQADRSNLLKYLEGSKYHIHSDDGEGEGSGFHYSDFLSFWSQEIDRSGLKKVLHEWVFKGDEVAENVFGRLYAGFVHPFIHFGFGLEFHQPAIVAEALAQACVHDNWMYEMIQAVEKASSALRDNGIPSRLLSDLLLEARNNETLKNSPHWDDGNKMRQGVLGRAKQDLVDVASQWYLPKDPSWDIVKEKNAEHIHATFLFAATAAFHSTTSTSGKVIHYEPHLDFFYIHDTNSSIFFSSFIGDEKVRELLGKDAIVRMLQVKGWVDVGMYVSRGSPEITTEKLDQIRNYETKIIADRGKGWQRIFERVCSYSEDDGHAVKFIRALANAQEACKPYENKEWSLIQGDMWERIGWMAVDSLGSGPAWVRSTGWDEAWKDVPEWKVLSN